MKNNTNDKTFYKLVDLIKNVNPVLSCKDDLLRLVKKINKSYSIGEISQNWNYEIIQGLELLQNIKYLFSNKGIIYYNIDTNNFEFDKSINCFDCYCLIDTFKILNEIKTNNFNDDQSNILRNIATNFYDYLICVNRYRYIDSDFNL